MDFSEIYSFFININLQSIKLILKNWKSMASIAIITQPLLSILLFLFSIQIQSLMHNFSNSFMEPYTSTSSPETSPTFSSSQGTFLLHILMYMALLFLVQFAFMFAFVAIWYVSSVAAILISAASYTDNYISFQYFFSVISKKGKMLWTARGSRGSRTRPEQYLVLLLVLPLGLWVMYPSPLTFSIIILSGVVAAIFIMYSMVARNLAMVISVLEEGFYGKDALEKGEEVVGGHRVHGIVLNVFFTLVGLVLFLVYRLVSWDKVYLASPYFGLVMVNIFSLVNMLATVEYTVLYFECKKYHGQEIEVFRDLQYTEVPADDGAQV